jgi:hypothetical protein
MQYAMRIETFLQHIGVLLEPKEQQGLQRFFVDSTGGNGATHLWRISDLSLSFSFPIFSLLYYQKNPSVLFVLYLWCGLFFAISFSFFLRFTKLLHLDTPLFYLSPYINRYLQILLSLSMFALSSDDEVTFEQFQLLHMPKSKAVSSDGRDVSHHTTVTHIF